MKLLTLGSLFLLVASTGAQAQEGKLSKTELVIISDLSDRIDSHIHPGQLSRDTATIRMIADEFEAVVKKNRYLFSRDRMRALYVGGENPPTEPRVDVAKMNMDHRVVVREIGKDLASFVSAAQQPYLIKRSAYEGADLWSWFKHSAQSTLGDTDPDRTVKNRIVILTDGYLEFAPSVNREPGTYMKMSGLRNTPNWEAKYQGVRLKPVGFRLPPDTKVLMLEIAPVRPTVNTTERDIIERYWKDWFESMGATVEFRSTADAAPSVRDAIHRLLSQ